MQPQQCDTVPLVHYSTACKHTPAWRRYISYVNLSSALDLLQEVSLQAAFRISAAVLNLDPRKLPTDALQQVWALNQKLELLKIAFEVSCC